MKKIVGFMKKIKEKKGFTLVELIVVIAIIAILAAVAVPSLTKYISEANNAGKKEAIEVVRTAVQIAVIESTKAGGDITYTLFKDKLKEVLPEDKYEIRDESDKHCTIIFLKEKERRVTVGFLIADDKKSMKITSVHVASVGWGGI